MPLQIGTEFAQCPGNQPQILALFLAAMIVLFASVLTMGIPFRCKRLRPCKTPPAGVREGSPPNCTAGEFTTGITLQNGQNSSIECLAGQRIVVNVALNLTNVALSLTGSNTDYQDVGFFVGQQQNDHRAMTGSCSVATFPKTPLPWKDNDDGDACGDFAGGGTATPVIENVKILCQGNPATGRVTIPYLLTYW